MSEELKPCPFCASDNLGHSLKVASRSYNKDAMYHSVIYCKDCHTYGKRVLCYSSEQWRYTEDEKAMFKNEAIKAWNTRHIPDATEGELKAMAEAMSPLGWPDGFEGVVMEKAKAAIETFLKGRR